MAVSFVWNQPGL